MSYWIKCNVIKAVVFTLLVKPIANCLELNFHKCALTFGTFSSLHHPFQSLKLPLFFAPLRYKIMIPGGKLYLLYLCVYLNYFYDSASKACFRIALMYFCLWTKHSILWSHIFLSSVLNWCRNMIFIPFPYRVKQC